MASMQCYKEEAREFDYYDYGNPKPYSNSGYEKSYYEKEKCYEAKPGMIGYGPSHGHQHGSNPCGPMMGHVRGDSSPHGGMGYGMGHNSNHGGMGYDASHNMHKPASNGLGLGLGLGLEISNNPLGHVMGFGKKHEGHGSYAMGSSDYNSSYKKQHRRRRGYGSGNDCSDSSDDERRC